MRLLLQLLLLRALLAQALADLFALSIMRRQTRFVPLCICTFGNMRRLEHLRRWRPALLERRYPFRLGSSGIGRLLGSLVCCLRGLLLSLADEDGGVDQLVQRTPV